MNLRERQAREYLEEAELSLVSAKAVLSKARTSGEKLWAHVIKAAYDAMEQAISAALARKGLLIPKDHPEKISTFVNSYELRDSDVAKTLFFWLRRRGRTQYIDIRRDKVFVPHEIFDEKDAERAIKDCERVIESVKEMSGFR